MENVIAALARSPRIPVRNAWHMLLYAWDMAEWRSGIRAGSEDAPTLLGLLARVLEEATRRIFARQLGRAHTRRTTVVPGIRGRIDFARSLKRMEFLAGRAVCNYSELSIDTLRNRILRATLHRLARDSRVDHSASSKAADLRIRLRELDQRMEGVSLVAIGSSDFGRVQLGRNDREYALPLAVCQLLHGLRIPTEHDGDHLLAALCHDEIGLPRLFEAFVRNFYRHHLPACDVCGEVLHWPDELGSFLVPSMRTDVTITWPSPQPRRLVIDAKFYEETLSEGPFGKVGLRSSNLYQLYAYLRTQEHLSPTHGAAEGLLLYPTTGHDLNERMLVQGHLIRAATVDLAKPWQEIERRLLELVTVGLSCDDDGPRKPIR